jgi:hypothetical protein
MVEIFRIQWKYFRDRRGKRFAGILKAVKARGKPDARRASVEERTMWDYV